MKLSPTEVERDSPRKLEGKKPTLKVQKIEMFYGKHRKCTLSSCMVIVQDIS